MNTLSLLKVFFLVFVVGVTFFYLFIGLSVIFFIPGKVANIAFSVAMSVE